MKILLISDTTAPQLYDHFDKKRFEDIDLILSAGDLKADYLSFLVTMLNVPLLYIHGNHDDKYERKPPYGCVSIEDKVYDFKGLKILGLGGCMEYRGGLHQYTEKAMTKKIRRMKWKTRKGFDILLTHSPAYELGDGKDHAHTGFKCFIDLLDKHQPKYMIHGHQHLNYGNNDRILHYKDTTIINAYGYYILEIN